MSAALLYAGKLATDTAIGFVSYMSARQAAKADARIAGANARARYAADAGAKIGEKEFE